MQQTVPYIDVEYNPASIGQAYLRLSKQITLRTITLPEAKMIGSCYAGALKALRQEHEIQKYSDKLLLVPRSTIAHTAHS